MQYSPGRRSSFAQRVRGYVHKRQESAKRGGGSRGRSLNIRWGSRWRPPKNKTTKFRALPGDYKGFDGNTYEYHQYVEIFSARTKKSFCSTKKWGINSEGDLVAAGGDCLGYDEWKREIDEGVPRDKRTVSLRLLHAFNGIHLAWYHLVPVFDDNGKPVLYQKGDRKGEQVHRKEECEGRRCGMCKDKLEKVFGKKVHWSLGGGHLGDLAGVISEIEKDCLSCGGQGSLEIISYECSKCGHGFIDMENTDMADEQIFHASGQIQKCSECGTKDYMLEQPECSECQDPMKTSIFDVDLEIKRQGEGTNSTIQVPRWTTTELPEELQEMAKPWPFNRIFAGDPLDIQAKLLKVSNPYGKGGSSKDADEHAGDYDEADYGE